MNKTLFKQADSRWGSKPYPSKGSSFFFFFCGCVACTHLIIENEKYKAELKCIVTDVTMLNYSDQRMHKLEILDFNGCFEEYLQILYDRIPTLPQSLQRDFGILRHFWRNIAFRIARSEK